MAALSSYLSPNPERPVDRDLKEFLSFVATILAFGVAVMCCLIVGMATLLGSPRVADNFEAWGLPSWVRLAVGSIELIGAVALLVPPINFGAAFVLMAVTVFRIAMNMRGGEVSWLAWAALAALAFIAYRFRPGRIGRILAEDPAQFS